MATTLHHIAVMKNFFESEKLQHKHYSLRQFAKKLGISPSGLSEILNRKKFVSAQAAIKLAAKLHLIGSEKDQFILSCLIDRTKNQKIKESAVLKFNLIKSKIKKTKYFNDDNLNDLNTWLQFTIMELITFKEFQNDLTWLSKKIGLEPAATKFYISRLLELGWIVKEDGTYKMGFSYCESTQDISSENIKQYHKTVLKKASEVLFEQVPTERDYQSSIIGFKATPENLKAAKEDIRHFVDMFTEKYCHDEDKNQVYQLGLQFFALTKPH